jgi:hypothetical protein
VTSVRATAKLRDRHLVDRTFVGGAGSSPIRNVPPGTTTISGQLEQSAKTSPGDRRRRGSSRHGGDQRR